MELPDRLILLERRILKAAGGDFLAALDEIRVILAGESPDIRRALLDLVAPRVDMVLLSGALAGYDLGVEDAQRLARLAKADPIKFKKATAAMLSAQLLGDLGSMTAELALALVRARRLAASGADPALVMAPLFQAGNKLKIAASSAAHAAASEGVIAYADAEGVPVVWVAERDACLHCLRYAGEYADRGEFKTGLTYGKKAQPPRPGSGDFTSAPLHPRCRCYLEPLYSVEYAAALRREADRSVLRGFSLPSESEKARLEAAARLVSGGVSAPASVIAYAKRAVASGEFPTRKVPA